MSDKEDEELKDRGDEFVPETEEDEDDELLDDEEDELLEEDDEDKSDDEESDDEDDDDDEEDEDIDEEDDDEDEGDEPRIPKSRLDQVIAQREEERRNNEWLKEQLEAVLQGKKEQEVVEEEDLPPTYDFDAAEIKYAEALLEGEVEEAAKIRREINKASSEERDYQIKQAKRSAADEAVSTTADSLDQRRFEGLLNQYISEHDIFNDKSKGYNEKAVGMANRLMTSYVAEGNTRSEALALAVEEVLPLFEKEEKPKASTRSKTARKKAARASNSQPPSTQGKSTGRKSAGKANIEKMSDRAFKKLTAREKAQLRGDLV